MADEIKDAVISDDGLYRYLLVRQWDPSKELVAFLMLNPSTADKKSDDATTRACRAIAQHAGFGGMIFINLYAFRSKDPDGLYLADDPVGPDNEKTIKWALRRVTKIILAWGNRGPTVLAGHTHAVLNSIRNYWDECYALGVTGQGQPIHPRHMKADTPLRKVNVQSYLVGRGADMLTDETE